MERNKDARRELSAEVRSACVLCTGGSCTARLHQLELIVNEADKPLPYRVYIFVIAVTCISTQFWRENGKIPHNGTLY